MPRHRSAVMDPRRLRGTETEPSSAGVEPAPLAPVVNDGFKAMVGSTSPSDTTGAAGLGRVVTAVNVRYAVYDKAPAGGSPTPLRAGSLRSLFPGLPNRAFLFDPRVVYDPFRNRFVLVFLAARGPGFPGSGDTRPRSWILVAVIPHGTADRPGTWCRRKFDGDKVKKQGLKLWADFPGVGFDRSRVYISTNQFDFDHGGFHWAQILALPKSHLYDCSKEKVARVFARHETRDPDGSRGFTIQPAITEAPSGSDPPGFLLSFQNDKLCRNGLCGTKITAWRIRRARGRLRLSRQQLRVDNGVIPPYGTQKGGDFQLDTLWDTGDTRFTGSTFFDAARGRLYQAHAVRKDLGPDAGTGYIESAIRWYDIDTRPFSSARVVRSGNIGAAREDAAWPALATDAGGNLFVTYSQASKVSGVAEYLSAYAARVRLGATGFRPFLLAPGQARYESRPASEPERWGDYAAANRDPAAPGKVWLVNQFARSDGGGATKQWRQMVSKVSEAS